MPDNYHDAAVALWRLLATIDASTSEKGIRDLTHERFKIGLVGLDGKLTPPAPEVPQGDLVWSGTGWVSRAVAPPPQQPPVRPGQDLGSFVPRPVPLRPEELPGSPQQQVVVSVAASPPTPLRAESRVFSPEHALALAQEQSRKAAMEDAKKAVEAQMAAKPNLVWDGTKHVPAPEEAPKPAAGALELMAQMEAHRRVAEAQTGPGVN